MRADRTTIFIAATLILLGFFAAIFVRAVMVSRIPAFVPSPHDVTLTPPSAAKSAVLSATSGEVLAMPREASDYQEATPGGTLLQGESVATKKGTATVSLEGVISFGLDAESGIDLVSLDPSRLMVRQTSGSVAYIPAPGQSYSLRVLHALCDMDGQTHIALADGRVRITVVSGSGKIALVDTSNTTHVYGVAEGQTIMIDDATRSVSIR